MGRGCRGCRTSAGRCRPRSVSPLATVDGFSPSVLARGLVSFPSQEAVKRESPATKIGREVEYSTENLGPERAALARIFAAGRKRHRHELTPRAARQLGVTRARMTQLTNLLNLSPRVQESLLLGDLHLSERRIRAVVAGVEWEGQQGA